MAQDSNGRSSVVDYRDPETRLIEVLGTKNREALSRLLGDAPDQVLQLLSSKPALWDHAANADPEWVAEVYAETLAATGSASDTQETTVGDDSEDSAIGSAFASRLVQGLPDWILDFEVQFRELGPAVHSVVTDLSRHASVKHGGDFAVALTHYGLTPASIVDASAAMARVLRRFHRENQLSPGQSISLEDENSSELKRDLREEIAWTLEASDKTAGVLLDWILTLARYKPHILDGFEIITERYGLRIQPLREASRQDLEFLWTGMNAIHP